MNEGQPAGIVRPAEDLLAALAAEANDACRAGQAKVRKGLEDYARAGRALARARREVKERRGKWLDWLAQNWEFSQARAYHYIKLAEVLVTRNFAATSDMEAEWQRISGNTPPAEEAEPAPAAAPGYSNAIRGWLDRVRGQLMYFELEKGGVEKLLEEPEMFDWDAMTRELAPAMEELAAIMLKYARRFKDYGESRSR